MPAEAIVVMVILTAMTVVFGATEVLDAKRADEREAVEEQVEETTLDDPSRADLYLRGTEIVSYFGLMWKRTYYMWEGRMWCEYEETGTSGVWSIYEVDELPDAHEMREHGAERVGEVA